MMPFVGMDNSSPQSGEGETSGKKVPSQRVGSYAQHTRDYRGEVGQDNALYGNVGMLL